jgi:hypothetical protein
MRRHNRTLSAALALVAGLTLVGGATQAAPSRRTVDASDFPTAHQVGRISPVTSRHVEDDHAIWIFEANCSAYDTHGPSGVARKWAYFYGAADSDPTAYIRVQEFATVREAKQTIRTIRRNAEGCYGTHHVPSINGTLIRRGADVPSLGAGRPVAWKMNDRWTDQDTHQHNIYFSRRIWMREGRTVIGVDLWNQTVGRHDPPPISRADTIRLARLALRTVD